MSKKSTAVQQSAPAFDIEKTIQKRAVKVLARLLKRGGANDYAQARKYAAAAKSWCQMNPEIGKANGRFHSRRKGGATWSLWEAVISMCDLEATKGA